jgi:ELWxxDGT repeat protein
VQQLVASGPQLFLIVNRPDTGSELWVSDGTAAGTRLVRSFGGGADATAGIVFLSPFAGRVLMSANDGVHGVELWISDGSAGGTRLLGDLRPGAEGSYPQAFVDLGERCAFIACTSLGCEPWVTNGTPAGTRMVADVAEGVASSSPTSFAALHGTLYFAATDGVRGYELWREGEAPACRGDCRGDGRVTIDDLVQAVAIALGARPVGDCSAVDTGGDGRVTIDELIAAVGVALTGC